MANISKHTTHQLIILMEVKCVSCGVGTEYLQINEINYSRKSPGPF